MANDLNELNSILFDTLRGVKDGTVDSKNANAVIGISNALVNNAKVQLQAMKLAGQKQPTNFLGIDGPKNHNRYEASAEVAKKEGFKNVSEAIKAFGKQTFNEIVDDYLNRNGG